MLHACETSLNVLCRSRTNDTIAICDARQARIDVPKSHRLLMHMWEIASGQIREVVRWTLYVRCLCASLRKRFLSEERDVAKDGAPWLRRRHGNSDGEDSDTED